MSDHVTPLLPVTLDLQSQWPPSGLPAPSWSALDTSPTSPGLAPAPGSARLPAVPQTYLVPPTRGLGAVSPSGTLPPGSHVTPNLMIQV